MEKLTNKKGFTTFSLHKRGFTLIEVLVTVTIIAILAAIGLATYGTFIKNSRDVKRKSDLHFVQSALEQYFADQFYYPTKDAGVGSPCSNGKFKIGCPLKDPTGNKTYINNVALDPLSANPQYYFEAKKSSTQSCDNVSDKCLIYCLFAKLETATTPTPLTSNCPSYPAGGYNYFVTTP